MFGENKGTCLNSPQNSRKLTGSDRRGDVERETTRQQLDLVSRALKSSSTSGLQ